MKKIARLLVSAMVAACFLAGSPSVAQSPPIKIGAMFIASGKMGGYGKHGAHAIMMAVEEINAAGGILGRKVEAMVEDTQLKKDRALEIARRFVEEEKVDFLMGPTSSGLAVGLAEFAWKHKTILVVTQAATDALTGKLLNPYTFSTLSNAMMHSRAGAYLMARKPYKRWMVVGPDYNYGHSSWRMFIDKLKQLQPNVEVAGELFPKFMCEDYTETIDAVLAAKPDAVWCPLWGGDAVTFIRQGLPKKLFDHIKFAFPCGGALEVLEPLGEDMPDGLYMSARYLFTTPDSAMNNGFVKNYFEKYREYPDYMAGETYAGVYFIKAAVERAGTTDAAAVIQALEKEPLAWEAPEGWKILRPADHSVVEDVVWGETASCKKYDFSVPKNVQYIPGAEICRSPQELAEVRAAYEKKIQECK